MTKHLLLTLLLLAPLTACSSINDALAPVPGSITAPLTLTPPSVALSGIPIKITVPDFVSKVTVTQNSGPTAIPTLSSDGTSLTFTPTVSDTYTFTVKGTQKGAPVSGTLKVVVLADTLNLTPPSVVLSDTPLSVKLPGGLSNVTITQLSGAAQTTQLGGVGTTLNFTPTVSDTYTFLVAATQDGNRVAGLLTVNALADTLTLTDPGNAVPGKAFNVPLPPGLSAVVLLQTAGPAADATSVSAAGLTVVLPEVGTYRFALRGTLGGVPQAGKLSIQVKAPPVTLVLLIPSGTQVGKPVSIALPSGLSKVAFTQTSGTPVDITLAANASGFRFVPPDVGIYAFSLTALQADVPVTAAVSVTVGPSPTVAAAP